MSIQTAKLIVSIVDQATGPARAINNAVGRLNRANQANARELRKVQGQMLGAAGAAYAFARAIISPVKASMEFESAMSDVRKVVDFDTPEQFTALGQDIIALSKVLPIAATGIADIVAAAGQAGMAGDELLAFAEMAAKVGVAFDISAGESGTALAKIKTALGLTVAETGLLADGINHLTNNMASDAPSMINFMRRVAATGEQYGFAAVETAAIGSAMIAAGAEANVAATSFRNVGRALTLGTAATKAQNDAYERLGLKATDVAKSMQEDATGTLQDVLERIRALPRELQAATLSQLFGNEARALAPLVENIDLFTSALASVADPSAYAGSASAEYAVRADTAANKLQLLNNQASAVAIAIGDALVPSIISAAEVIGPMLGVIERLIKANPQLVASVAGVVGGLVGLRVATIAGRFAFLFLRGGVISTALAITKGAGGIVRGVGLISGGFKQFRAAILGAQMLSAVGSGGIFSTLLASLGGIGTAIATAIGAITAPVWGLIALFVGAAFAIWKFWEPISNFFGGFGEVVGGALAEAGAAIAGFAYGKLLDVAEMFGIDQATVDVALETVKTVIGDGWNKVVTFITSLPAQIGNWLGDIFKMNDYSDEEEAEFKSAGEKFGQALVDGIKFIGQSIFDWFTTWPLEILKSIGTIDLSSIIQLPDIGKMAGGIGGAVTGAFNSVFGGGTELPTRAKGGPVSAHSPYIVGEQGIEMFVPNTSGYIVDALATSRMLTGSIPNIRAMPSPPAMNMASNDNAANQNGARSQVITIGDVIVSTPTNADPQQIAYALGDEIARRVGGGFSDGGV